MTTLTPETNADVLAAGREMASREGRDMMLLVNRFNPAVWVWTENLSPAAKRLKWGDSYRKAAIAKVGQ
jgi:hypothetical protein